MNMITTGAFGEFQDASSNKGALAAKKVADFVQKSGDKARLGGVSLMAVSLAACGSSSTTTTTTDTSTDTTDTTTTTPTGSTYVLVKDVIDNITGGAGDDTIVGDAATVTIADQVDGGAGNDTYKHYDHATLPTLSNIENIEVIKMTDSDDLDVSKTGATKLTISQDGGTNAYSIAADMDVVISNTAIDNVADALEINTTSTDTSVTVTLDKVTSAGTSAQLEIDGAKLATINLNATGTKSTVDQIINTGGKVTKMDIGADVALTVTDALPTTIKTIDASDSTAAVNLQTGTVDLTFTGGAGDDRLNIGAISNLGAKDALDGGAGSDTVATSDSGAKFAAGELTLIKAELAKFEVLEFTHTLAATTAAGDELNIDFNEISVIDEVLLSADIQATTGASAGTDTATAGAGEVSVTITGAEAGDSLTIGDDENITGGDGGSADTTVATAAAVGGDGADGNTAISITEDVSTAENTFTITLSGNNDIAGGDGGNSPVTYGAGSGTDSSAGDAGDGIVATGIETLTIVSNGDGTTADNNSIAAGSVGTAATGAAAGAAGSSVLMGTNGKIVIEGSQALDLGTVGGTNVMVDASSFTGKLTVTGEAGNNIIKGGSAVDTIDGGEGADTLTGGAGNDIFIFTTAANSDTAAYDTITDFAAGDVLRFVSSDDVAGASAQTGTTATNNVEVNAGGKVTFASADDTLAEKLTAIAADTTDVNTNEIAFFEHDGSTYVFNNVGGTDDLVKLADVTGFTTITESTTTAGDFTLA